MTTPTTPRERRAKAAEQRKAAVSAYEARRLEQDRLALQIVALREKGLTYAAIGRMLPNKVTRQRIYQLAARAKNRGLV